MPSHPVAMETSTKMADDCPIPEVAEALSPYIHPRHEVSAIRRGLQKHLESQLPTGGAPVSSVNLIAPASLDSKLGPPPAGLSGVRKAYWNALQAHSAAQAQYDSLRAELDRVKYQRPATGTEDQSVSASVNEHYIPLFRQREKLRKLKAIDAAYSDVNAAGGDLSNNSFENVVKQQLGELPTPPSAQPSLGRDSEAEAKILELKKTLLSTQRIVEQRRNVQIPSKADGEVAIPPQAEIAGLQRALEELTGWMESQLSVIADSEADGGAVETPARNGSTSSSPLSKKDIGSLYTRYLTARYNLIHTVNKPPETKSNENDDQFLSPLKNAKAATGTAERSSAEIILPYIPTLLAAKEEEQALMHQNAYVRRSISTAEAETERLMHRLAEESHLVQPAAASGKAWAGAAKYAGLALETFVKGRVDAGEAFSESTSQGIEKTRTLPASLERLLEMTEK